MTQAAQIESVDGGWRRTFTALENPNFRWFWLSGLASSGSFQMGMLARGWLVYNLTGSALALGWVTSGWGLAILALSLFGGVVADRVRKRNLLMVSQSTMGLVNLGLALLIAAGAIEVWHLFAASTVTGIIFAFQIPSNDSFVAEIVDRKTLLNASSLNSVAMSLTGIVGAPLAGLVVQRVGVAGVYFLQVPLYVFIVFCLWHLPAAAPPNREPMAVWPELRDGLRYIGSHGIVVVLLVTNLVRVLLAMPYQSFLPVFAEDIYRQGASGLGLLQAAVSMGAMVGSLWVASLGDFRRKGGLLLLSGLVIGVGLVAFAFSPHFLLALLMLTLVGAASNICMVANFTLLQTSISDEIRGRVLSVAMWLWGFSPLGTMPAGALADRWAAPPVVALQGGLLASLFALMLLSRSELRMPE